MANENTSNGVWVGAIVGGAIGAISALLFAPKSGVQLREDISSKFKEISDKTKDIASVVGTHTKDVANQIKEEASDLVDHAKKSNHAIMDSFSSAKDDTKDEMAATGR